MFIGHFGAGMAGKGVARRVSLGTLFMAAEFIDLIWPIFLLLGWEEVRIVPGETVVTPLEFTRFPLSHSLLMVLGWSLGFGYVFYLFRRYLKGAIVVGALVLSHWFLDFIVQRPDLPLIPGLDIYCGLGLWNSLAGTLVVEGVVFAAGLSYYLRSTTARDKVGKYGIWTLVILLAIFYLANVFGPPPPSETLVAWGSLGCWLFVGLAYWIDRHRIAKQHS
jgi:hypothetical protein